MTIKLECRNLEFSYGETPILTGVSRAMNAGTFTALLGRNGSGKTTLLHCLNGIHRTGPGSVFIKGKDIDTLSRRAVARQISLVVQEAPEVFPFTVLDVVVMGRAPFLGMAQTPGPDDYALAQEALKTLDVIHLAHADFNRISGGERRMVLLASALVQSSEIMLLDEPTNHLDFKNQYLILSQIRQLCKKRGTTAVAAMHDPNMAMLFADEVVLLKDGVIFDAGPVNRVMTKINMDILYDTDTTALPFVGSRQFFIPTGVLQDAAAETGTGPGGHRIIITGSVQSGKSSLAWKLIEKLDGRAIPMGGFIAKGLWRDNQRSGFDLIELKTRRSTPLARREEKNPIDPKENNNPSMIPYTFYPQGMDAGMTALHPDNCFDAGVIMVDEIGKLEIRGKGWASCLPPLMGLTKAIHVWIVRDFLVDEVCRLWPFHRTDIVRVDEADALDKLMTYCTKEG